MIEQHLQIREIPEIGPYSSLPWGISIQLKPVETGFSCMKVQHPNSSSGLTLISGFRGFDTENHCFVHPTLTLYARTPRPTMPNC